MLNSNWGTLIRLKEKDDLLSSKVTERKSDQEKWQAEEKKETSSEMEAFPKYPQQTTWTYHGRATTKSSKDLKDLSTLKHFKRII